MTDAKLDSLGWRPHFAAQLTDADDKAHEIARVLAVHRGRIDVATQSGDTKVELCGKSAALGITVGDWVVIDPATLRTSHQHVFAIGDVTQIKLANGLPLPKAGLFAELQGEHVAAAIAADCGVGKPPADFDGRGFCFVEMGKSVAARIEGDFFARPEPNVQVTEASESQADAKRQFEKERLQRWFGG